MLLINIIHILYANMHEAQQKYRSNHLTSAPLPPRPSYYILNKHSYLSPRSLPLHSSEKKHNVFFFNSTILPLFAAFVNTLNYLYIFFHRFCFFTFHYGGDLCTREFHQRWNIHIIGSLKKKY